MPIDILHPLEPILAVPRFLPYRIESRVEPAKNIHGAKAGLTMVEST
jgi:hypothetical protein